MQLQGVGNSCVPSANLAACTGSGRKERGLPGTQVPATLGWRALILSWEGTALPLIWEKKGREEETRKVLAGLMPQELGLFRAALVRCQEGPGVHLLLRGSAAQNRVPETVSSGGDGGLRGLGVIIGRILPGLSPALAASSAPRLPPSPGPVDGDVGTFCTTRSEFCALRARSS